MSKPHFNYSLPVNKIRTQVMEEAEKATLVEPGFVSSHLSQVEIFANELCDKYPQADRDLVGLGVWLHDAVRLKGIEHDHDKLGAENAKKVLEAENYPPDRIKWVYEICRAHSCKDFIPQSLEAKILATADAMSHFTYGFYLKLFNYFSEKHTYNEAVNLIKTKIQRDYGTKIFFDEGREKVKEKYEALLLVFSDQD